MPIDTARFQRDRQAYIRQLRDGYRDEIRDIGLQFHFLVFEAGPLKKGQSSASWNIQNGSPNTFAYDDTFNDPSPARFLNTHRNVADFQLGETLWISNHVHYIGFIESLYGWIASETGLLESRLRAVGAI